MGSFTKAEDATERLFKELGEGFPNIASQQKRQMKDVEFTANLLLLLEKGALGYSAAQLDEEFSKRDEEWQEGDEMIEKFDSALRRIKSLLATPTGVLLRSSRLRNQADFYSLFGAIAFIPNDSDWERAAAGLKQFIDIVNDDAARGRDETANR